MSSEDPTMYGGLASFFHLYSPPSDYVDEAEAVIGFAEELLGAGPGKTLLELGSGGGSLAFNYKHHFDCTLSDLSAEMLEASRRVNPECEFVQGDMRTLRLGRQFDVVLVEDAIEYMLTEDDLRNAIATVFAHCRSGGIAIFAPDVVQETFSPDTDSGGTDEDGRGIRVLQWLRDPDPTDNRYALHYVFLFHEADGRVRCVYEAHEQGLFPRETWLRLLGEAGFEAQIRQVSTEDDEEILRDFFVCRRR